MHGRRKQRWIGLAVLGALACLGMAGCGGEEGGPGSDAGQAESEWSEPAGGSPDGDPGGGVKSAAAVLERLRARVQAGEGHSDPTFQRDVEAVAEVLWSSGAEGADLQAARVHTEVANIAGDVSRWMAESEQVREERRKSNPTDVALHAGFLEAAAAGPDAYRAWCGAAGAKLLLAHKEAQYRKHFPPR